jgi:hypothetical protein
MTARVPFGVLAYDHAFAIGSRSKPIATAKTEIQPQEDQTNG